MRQAPCASRANAKIVIGPNTGVYVGGLPLNFEIRRSSSDPRMKVIVSTKHGSNSSADLRQCSSTVFKCEKKFLFFQCVFF